MIMKKLILSAAAMVFVAAAGVASANPTAFTGTTQVTHGTAGDCPLLAETVNLNVSAKVHGAWQCNEVNGVIKVATCHEGGSRSPLICAEILDENGVPSGTFNAPDCNATNVGEASTVPDYTAYSASNRGGIVMGRQLGGRCNDGTLTALEFWAEN